MVAAGKGASWKGTGKGFAVVGSGKGASDNCCCTYEASDGTDQSDNFNTDDGPPLTNWIERATSPDWKATGGKCHWEQPISGGDTTSWIYRTFTVAQEDGLEIIAEVDVARLNSDSLALEIGILLDWDKTDVLPSNYITVTANYNGSAYLVTLDGASVSLVSPPTPAADKITIHLREHDTGLFVFCVYVDEVLIGHACADWNGGFTPTGSNVNAVRLAISGNSPPTMPEDRGEFDNYLLEINDP